MKRPGSLAEVAVLAAESGSFYAELSNFLDQFYLDRQPGMLAVEPPLLADRIADGAVADAYLAAVAVELSRLLGEVPPSWVHSGHRKLRIPWFASPGAAVRALLIVESPAGFRERNIFVSENALSRA